MTSRVAILVSSAAIDSALSEGLWDHVQELSHYPSVGALLQAAIQPDILLIDLPHFSLLREREPVACLRLSRRGRILLVLSLAETLDAAPLLPFADAWIFTDSIRGRARPLVTLGREAHTALPPQLLSQSGIDQMRLPLLDRLSPAEHRCLLALGQGLNNRNIGKALGLPEATVKSLVRSMLSRLHFRNRTEAGVFAARNQATIQSAGHDRILH
ncbi:MULTISPECIES: helix-turn-helix transcriptional regulator [unclassified Azospirillum]|uniref:helix-turn-helix transcriptional regulator n=1 Tax=unclassified Azospirillum TaxID=2630922 RepID=UPI00135CEEF1|nr:MULTISPECIES: helix-turn-helix transcriptional regulator [unclassified Azospirillum]